MKTVNEGKLGINQIEEVISSCLSPVHFDVKKDKKKWRNKSKAAGVS